MTGKLAVFYRLSCWENKGKCVFIAVSKATSWEGLRLSGHQIKH